MSNKRLRLSFGFLAILSLVFFVYTTIAVFRGGDFAYLDSIVYEKAPEFQSSTLTLFMAGVSNTLSPGVFVFLAVLAALFLVANKEKRYAGIFLFSVLLTLLSAVSIKEISYIQRPAGIVSEFGYGFPSIHSAVAAVFFICAIYTLIQHIKEGILESFIVIVGVMLIFLTALSRLYLQVHWFSDVLGGLALGVFWGSLIISIFHRANGGILKNQWQ